MEKRRVEKKGRRRETNSGEKEGRSWGEDGQGCESPGYQALHKGKTGGIRRTRRKVLMAGGDGGKLGGSLRGETQEALSSNQFVGREEAVGGNRCFRIN